MSEIWDGLIIGSLVSGLVYLNGALGSFGLAIIVFTVAIKLVTFPLTYQQIKSSKAMRDVQPFLEEAKRRCGKDREKLTHETMRIYKENGINPAMGCLPMLVQMPIWFGLYYALIFLKDTVPGFDQPFLWLPSLAQPDPFYVIVALTVVTQFVVQKMMVFPSSDPQQQMMNKVMLFMPLTFGFVAMSVPSGLALYWVTTNVFTFFQQLLTTGWGDLLPKKPIPAVAGARVQPSSTSNGGSQGTAVERPRALPETRVSKASKHKKRVGTKPPREEKRANGKR